MLDMRFFYEQEALPDQHSVATSAEPVMVGNMALKNAVKQIDKDVVSLSNNLHQVTVIFLKDLKKTKKICLYLGREIV